MFVFAIGKGQSIPLVASAFEFPHSSNSKLRVLGTFDLKDLPSLPGVTRVTHFDNHLT